MAALRGATTAFILSTDLERARPFYVDRLELPLILDDALALDFDLGGTRLRIARVPSFSPHPFTVFSWQVDDIYATLRQLAVEPLRDARLKYDESGVRIVGNGTRLAHFADPDGNILSLTQR
jgi:catechol 2,3-dioxygenase-like lactoylglutathione lyase family enzyme